MTTEFAHRNEPLNFRSFPWTQYNHDPTTVVKKMREPFQMELKNPLAMSIEQVHSAIWQLQKWEKTNTAKTRLPIVFHLRSGATIHETSGTRTEGKGKCRVRDPSDRRIVDPENDVAVGALGTRASAFCIEPDLSMNRLRFITNAFL